MEIDGEFMIVLAKFLIGVIVLSILFIGIYMALKSKGVGFSSIKKDIDSTKKDIIYVLWIGNIQTTLHILDLVKNTTNQKQTVIQPIFIPDPEDAKNNKNVNAKWEYELQITRDLRKQIMEKYPEQGQRILPIINITKLQPDDDAFNQAYDKQYLEKSDGTIQTNFSNREAILARWALYYNITITQPNYNLTQPRNKTGDTKILINTWDCRFPVGKNQVPCGLCKKCEKINNLI